MVADDYSNNELIDNESVISVLFAMICNAVYVLKLISMFLTVLEGWPTKMVSDDVTLSNSFTFLAFLFGCCFLQALGSYWKIFTIVSCLLLLPMTSHQRTGEDWMLFIRSPSRGLHSVPSASHMKHDRSPSGRPKSVASFSNVVGPPEKLDDAEEISPLLAEETSPLLAVRSKVVYVPYGFYL